MRMKLWLAVGIVATSSHAVDAQSFKTAGGLMKNCADETGAMGGQNYYICLGYIAGVADGEATAARRFQSAHGTMSPATCIPEGFVPLQIRERVVAYLEAHPEEAGTNAADVITDLFQQIYPCAGSAAR